MAIEYLGLSQINGPLVVLEGVQNASFEEIVEITVNGNEKKLGRIIELYEDKAVIQVFEGNDGMSLKNTHTKLTGHPMEVALSPDILGVPSECQRPAAEPCYPGVPQKLYPYRYFRHRRADHLDQRPEAADLLRKRTSP